MTTIKASELKLADVIRTSSGADAYNTATVKKVENGYITLFRPFVQTADFSYTGGVICYIGIEEYVIRADDTEYVLLASKELK